MHFHLMQKGSDVRFEMDSHAPHNDRCFASPHLTAFGESRSQDDSSITHQSSKKLTDSTNGRKNDDDSTVMLHCTAS